LIDELGGAEGLPAALRRIGMRTTKELVVEAAHGYYAADSNLLSWRRTSAVDDVAWSLAGALPADLAARLSQHLRLHILPWERVLLDLHSGRILGRAGPYVMDLAALLMIFLGVSGFWLWLRQRRKMKSHQKKMGAHGAPISPPS
jgi:uncharacterized iron-regulated membrane protein